MNLYLRLLRLLLLLPFVRRAGGLFEESRIDFRALPNDCDINLHLNNGRYLSFMDLGRVHLLACLGMLAGIVRRRWAPVLTAAEMNFIRPIRPLQRFTLVSRLLAWDEKYFYVEQRFVAGGRLCAVGMVRGLFIHRGRALPTTEFLAGLGIHASSPEMPEVVRHWRHLTDLKKRHTDQGGAS